MKKHLRGLGCLLLCAALLTGCTAEHPALPALTLPPAAEGPEAPVGDAGLQREVIVPLYLPAHDGQTLLPFYETLTLALDVHPAESILRALLAHPGSDKASAPGKGTLALSGANPAEVSGGVCTVNLSASALSLSAQELYTAALSIAATLCGWEDIQQVTLLVAGTPLAMDVGGNLPLGLLGADVRQELPVLWDQFSARRTPVGQLASATPFTAQVPLYFPLADASGVAAEPRRIAFPGQHPQQQVIALLEALFAGPEAVAGAAPLPGLDALTLFAPEVTDLASGGRRVTLHLCADAVARIRDAGCDPVCAFAAITLTLTTFVPSVQQVCVLLGDGALTSLYSDALGSFLFPGGLMTRSQFADVLMAQTTVFVPGAQQLHPVKLSLPYRSAGNPRQLLLRMAEPAVGALPAGLTDADILGISIAGDTALLNLSDRCRDLLRADPDRQRLTAYAIVNTLCAVLDVRRVRITFGGQPVDELGSDLRWSGEFLYLPTLIAD